MSHAAPVQGSSTTTPGQTLTHCVPCRGPLRGWIAGGMTAATTLRLQLHRAPCKETLVKEYLRLCSDCGNLLQLWEAVHAVRAPSPLSTCICISDQPSLRIAPRLPSAGTSALLGIRREPFTAAAPRTTSATVTRLSLCASPTPALLSTPPPRTVASSISLTRLLLTSARRSLRGGE